MPGSNLATQVNAQTFTWQAVTGAILQRPSSKHGTQALGILLTSRSLLQRPFVHEPSAQTSTGHGSEASIPNPKPKDLNTKP